MDDLTRIDGIGKATAKRLAVAGIETFAHLAAIEDGEDGRAEQLGVRPAWIAEAAKIVAESKVSEGQSPADAAAAPDPAGLAKAGGDPSTTAEDPAGDDAPSAIDVAGTDTEGKPPRPDHGAESTAEAAALPADSGAGDRQQDNPRGSSGTAREAPGTDGGTTAETPSVGTQSGSPNPSSDTVQESMGVGDAPIAGVPDAPLGDEAEAVAAVTTLRGPHAIADKPAGAGELIAKTIATVVSGERRRFPVNWALMHDGRLVEEGGKVELTLIEHQKLASGVVPTAWLSGEPVE